MKKNLTNKVFGSYVVLSEDKERSNSKHRYWLCLCECGEERVFRQDKLKNKPVCICSNSYWDGLSKLNYKHGFSHSACDDIFINKVYRAWKHIKSRCKNKNVPDYHNYGGRGIKICDEWDDDFTLFFSHVGMPPSLQHSIDRIDNNGHYEPGNLRWATKSQQSQNRRPSSEWFFKKRKRGERWTEKVMKFSQS